MSNPPTSRVQALQELEQHWRKFAGECRRCGQIDAADTAIVCADELAAALAAEPEGQQAWLLTETWHGGRKPKDRTEGIALTNEDADYFVRQDFEQGYSRTSLPFKIYRRPTGRTP